MIVERRMIAPPYLQFFISDPTATDVPIQGENIRIISSGECISVPCQYYEEGDTELIVGRYEDVKEGGSAAFDGVIKTPSRVISFTDAELNEWIAYPTYADRTRIRIWTDGSILPDRVVVGIG